ncbi:hypothetical protein DI53_2908 [Sphingobacterium deserti]|uniref:Uncharacterized protein n=1 Tax=Sphingobacterium deserti TaxID=1229276 RepID=A0A0B8SZN5_9SPHI|nr:hypothetical protein DI53_2908 [Sphingobacterium deserti]
MILYFTCCKNIIFLENKRVYLLQYVSLKNGYIEHYTNHYPLRLAFRRAGRHCLSFLSRALEVCVADFA